MNIWSNAATAAQRETAAPATQAQLPGWDIPSPGPLVHNVRPGARAERRASGEPPRDFSTSARDALYRRFHARIKPNHDLDRGLVSSQADKDTPFYRWFRYREGFTSRLVQYLLSEVHSAPGVLLDPFAGSGSALFAAASLGWSAQGIELLPVGHCIARAREAAQSVDAASFAETVRHLCELDYERYWDAEYRLRHIPITQGAFPDETSVQLEGYIAYCNRFVLDDAVRTLALFAAFCVLEAVSYTRKDGQYLRWDYRSGRSQGARPFDKGPILSFRAAIRRKLEQIASDLRWGSLAELPVLNRPEARAVSSPSLAQGSVLEVLPTWEHGSVDVTLTSPPYCNRYDYTRTYALELVFLGCTHEDVLDLRQAMLSCTVENRTKREHLRTLYSGWNRQSDFERVNRTFEQQAALQEVLGILDTLRAGGQLNNDNIARMVRNYFYEMCFTIYELARVTAPGGHVIMVNDNVRYAGEEVPVDLILSSFAESFGLVTDVIWTLPRGKGNSSQQMGAHGRSELRKCVYVWRKPTTGERPRNE